MFPPDVYDSLYNFTVNLGRFFFSFTLLYIVLPKIFFPQEQREGVLDSFFANFARMVFLNIIIIYLLVLIKLYEVISLSVVYLAVLYWRWLSANPGEKRHIELSRLVQRFFDLVDGLLRPLETFGHLLRKSVTSSWQLLVNRFSSPRLAAESLLWLGVMGSSAYLRFWDALKSAAPAMSDAYVTLAWMKYIERRELFYEGIYPQGFHIYLSTLHKFAAVDALFVLKYAGPLNGVLITLSVYYVVSRLTGNFMAGVAGAFVYGVVGMYLPMEFARQASTNSQEFGLVFLLPTLWFAIQYLRTGKKEQLYIFFSSLSVVGLVHSMVALFVACGLLAVAAGVIFTGRSPIMRVVPLIKSSSGAALLWILPAIAGLAMGKSFHSSSAKFATYVSSQKIIATPEISFFVWPALIGVIMGMGNTIIFKRERGKRDAALFGVFLIVGSLLVYKFSYFVQVIAIAIRSGEFLALAFPVGIGFLWYTLTCHLPKNQYTTMILPVSALAIMISFLYYFPVKPAEPYKMQWDEAVKQYLRITREYRPTEWLMISQEEGYALALGKGWHLMTGDFLGFNPFTEKPVYMRKTGPGGLKKGDTLKNEHIFIFHEKNLFEPPLPLLKVTEPILARRRKEEKQLAEWIANYRRTHKSCQHMKKYLENQNIDRPIPCMGVYYEDKNLQVMVIHQPKSKKDKFEKLWGNKGD